MRRSNSGRSRCSPLRSPSSAPSGRASSKFFDLPFILPSHAALRKVTDGELGKRLFKKLETKGIVGLAYWDNGFKIMSANRPVRVPEDFRGLKMRIQSSKVLEAQMRAFGRHSAGDGLL